MSCHPSSALHPTESAPRLSPWIFVRARRTKTAWELVTHYMQTWVVAIGRVTPHGLIVYGELLPWPSRLHARLWRRFAHGLTQDQVERLFTRPRVVHVIADETPWKRLSFNLLGEIAYPSWTTWPDPTRSDLARVRWVPRYCRVERDGRFGWSHPALPAFFIPDSDLLTPIIQRIPWDTPESLGVWLHHAIGQWEQHEAPDAWFDQADATHLTTERLMGMQFAIWTSMGLGYFDATLPLNDWLSLWPAPPAWVLALDPDYTPPSRGATAE